MATRPESSDYSPFHTTWFDTNSIWALKLSSAAHGILPNPIHLRWRSNTPVSARRRSRQTAQIRSASTGWLYLNPDRFSPRDRDGSPVPRIPVVRAIIEWPADYQSAINVRRIVASGLCDSNQPRQNDATTWRCRWRISVNLGGDILNVVRVLHGDSLTIVVVARPSSWRGFKSYPEPPKR